MSTQKLILAALCVVLLSGCAAPGAPYTVVTEGTLSVGDPIPLPERAILTVTGRVGATNSGDSIKMDAAGVEAAGQVDYTVEDPFLKTEVTYRGPLVADLLDLWQADPEATTLHITALNDYSIDVPISMMREYPVLLALQADGEYMAVEDRGPAMLVFPYDDFNFERPATDALWIWQIATIEVR